MGRDTPRTLHQPYPLQSGEAEAVSDEYEYGGCRGVMVGCALSLLAYGLLWLLYRLLGG